MDDQGRPLKRSRLWLDLKVKKQSALKRKGRLFQSEGTASAVQGHNWYVGGTKKEDRVIEV